MFRLPFRAGFEFVAFFSQYSHVSFRFISFFCALGVFWFILNRYLNCVDVTSSIRVVYDRPAVSCNDSKYKSQMALGYILLIFPTALMPCFILLWLLRARAKKQVRFFIFVLCCWCCRALIAFCALLCLKIHSRFVLSHNALLFLLLAFVVWKFLFLSSAFI